MSRKYPKYPYNIFGSISFLSIWYPKKLIKLATSSSSNGDFQMSAIEYISEQLVHRTTKDSIDLSANLGKEINTQKHYIP